MDGLFQDGGPCGQPGELHRHPIDNPPPAELDPVCPWFDPAVEEHGKYIVVGSESTVGDGDPARTASAIYSWRADA